MSLAITEAMLAARRSAANHRRGDDGADILEKMRRERAADIITPLEINTAWSLPVHRGAHT